jgi:hypothetical protein
MFAKTTKNVHWNSAFNYAQVPTDWQRHRPHFPQIDIPEKLAGCDLRNGRNLARRVVENKFEHLQHLRQISEKTMLWKLLKVKKRNRMQACWI